MLTYIFVGLDGRSIRLEQDHLYSFFVKGNTRIYIAAFDPQVVKLLNYVDLQPYTIALGWLGTVIRVFYIVSLYDIEAIQTVNH